MTEPLKLLGAPGSPYTRKMIALLRYRRIPYTVQWGSHMQPPEGLPTPKLKLLPTVYFPLPDGTLEPVVDSTPIIRRLEREHEGRSLVPADPALAFIDELIEDFADEWLTKAMFHYRWSYEPDIAKAAALLPCWRGFCIPDDELAARGRMVAERQIGRLRYVGSNPGTGPVIEASYRRFLELFEAHLRGRPYLMGERPGASDFAAFGQLTQLAEFDPTPAALTLQVAPRVAAWVGLMEDQSGLEPQAQDWLDLAAPPATLKPLLAEIGRTYVPLMLANARAVAAGAEEVQATVDGQAWRQQPFPYQAKCLKWLRESHAALDGEARAQVDGLLAGTGCEALFDAGA